MDRQEGVERAVGSLAGALSGGLAAVGVLWGGYLLIGAFQPQQSCTDWGALGLVALTPFVAVVGAILGAVIGAAAPPDRNH